MKNIIKSLFKKLGSGIVIAVGFAIGIIAIMYAITWPSSTPAGETTGGKFYDWFVNKVFKQCPSGSVLRGYDTNKNPVCSNGSDITAVSSLNSRANDLTNRLNGLQSSVNGLNGSVSGLRGNVNDLTNRLNGLQSSVNSVNSNLTNLTSRVSTLESRGGGLGGVRGGGFYLCGPGAYRDKELRYVWWGRTGDSDEDFGPRGANWSKDESVGRWCYTFRGWYCCPL